MLRGSVAERVGIESAKAQTKARTSGARDRLRDESLGIRDRLRGTTRDRLRVGGSTRDRLRAES
jgi:hypothetical protein